MDKKGKKKKESDDSVQPPPRKRGLKFAPKVPHKKYQKIAPKMEIKEESKEYTIDNDMILMMNLKASQSMDVLGNEAKTVFIKKNKAEAEKNDSDVSAAKLPTGITILTTILLLFQ